MTTKYWATEDTRKLLGSLTDKISNYYDFVQQTFIPLWRRSFREYNKAAFTVGTMQTVGANNEYKRLGANHYRNLIEHSITMAINQRPAWEPRATNTDHKSQTQTILARGLLDYYMKEKKLAEKLKQALIYASLYAEGFLVLSWNATSGKVYAIDEETGIEQHEGDLEYAAYEPINVIRDTSLMSSHNNSWYIIRKQVNRWDLIAKYGQDPRVAQALQGQQIDNDPRTRLWEMSYQQTQDSDMIDVFMFYHDRTAALPNGRYTLFTKDVVLQDGPLPSRKQSVYRIAGGELDTTPFGYTNNYDLLSVQQMVDILYSTIATNQEAFGVQNIVGERGSGVSFTSLRDGMNYIEYAKGFAEPKALNLVQTPAEIFNFLKMLEQLMETLSGVNSVARGNPEASLKSGAALALVQSMAVQFMMGLQSSYIQLLEDVGTGTLWFLQDYASVPRMAEIAGKNKRGMMQEFSSRDIDAISRVQVDAGNPMAKTAAGRLEMANNLLEGKLINTHAEYLMVLQTGQLDPMLEGPTNKLLALRSENEELANGVSVPVMISDDHKLHIEEHGAILADPIARREPAIVEVVTAHMLEHIAFLSDPANAPLLQMLGQEPLAQQQAAGAAPGMPGMAGAGVEPANDMAAGMQPELPSAPKNAMTGQPAELPEGAAVRQ